MLCRCSILCGNCYDRSSERNASKLESTGALGHHCSVAQARAFVVCVAETMAGTLLESPASVFAGEDAALDAIDLILSRGAQVLYDHYIRDRTNPFATSHSLDLSFEVAHTRFLDAVDRAYADEEPPLTPKPKLTWQHRFHFYAYTATKYYVYKSISYGVERYRITQEPPDDPDVWPDPPPRPSLPAYVMPL